jgi:hypothetical protein
MTTLLPSAEEMAQLAEERRKAAAVKSQARYEKRKLREEREQLNLERMELTNLRARLQRMKQGGAQNARGQQQAHGHPSRHVDGSSTVVSDKAYECALMLGC